VVVEAGVTAKLVPLAELPMDVPPEETEYHFIVFPDETAFN
jgi:hypothetical protein